MMQYLMCLVLTVRHKKIPLSFLLTGHTKFSCNWCFGLVKRLYQKIKIDCLDNFAAVVSQVSNVNIAQVCDHEMILPFPLCGGIHHNASAGISSSNLSCDISTVLKVL